MPAGSTGQDGGIAACQSSLTHARSAAAANGRIRQPTPVIIPLAPPRRRMPGSGAGRARRGDQDCRAIPAAACAQAVTWLHSLSCRFPRACPCWSPAGQRAADRHPAVRLGSGHRHRVREAGRQRTAVPLSGPRRPCSWAVGFTLADLLATRVMPPGPSHPTCRSRIICSVITPAGSPDHGLSPGAVPRRRGPAGWGHARPVLRCPSDNLFARTVRGSPVPTCTSRR